MNQVDFNTHHVTISKPELAQLPCVDYRGSAVVIDRESEVEPAVRELESARVIGFDTETRPSFKKGVTHVVSLMQLASPERCFLFRLNKIGLHPRIKELLESPDHLKVGLSIHDDFHNLSKLGELHPAGFIDLQQFVKDYHIADNSLTRIHAILFGLRISKGQRLTNWEALELTESQINYAALDAISCIRIYDYLRSGVFHPEKSRYLREIEIPQADAEKHPEEA